MEEKTINYHKEQNTLSQSEPYKTFIIERNKLLLQLEETWFHEDVKQDLGHLKFVEILKAIAAQDKEYQDFFMNKKLKHSIIERNRRALTSEEIQ